LFAAPGRGVTVRGTALPPPAVVVAILAVAAVDVALGFGFARHHTLGIAVALLPAVAIAFGAFVASTPAWLVYAALALNILYPLPLDKPLPLRGGVSLYLPDVLVALALAGWAAGALVTREARGLRWPRTPVLGWPFALFAVLVVLATVRGHERYGVSLLSIPLRLVVYAGIGAAMGALKPRQTYRALLVVFYLGAIWQTLVGVYYLATGSSDTSTGQISTGGIRVLAGSAAIFLSGSFLLALLSLLRTGLAREQAVHLAMLAISAFGIVLTFQRTTFAAIGLVVPVLFLLVRRLPTNVASYLPLCAPFVAAFALLLPTVAPQIGPTLVQRLTATPASDSSARWRQAAIGAVFQQVRESPITGVGFGRQASFTLNGVRVQLSQDPHDQFIYLWAGGGLLLLGSFVLLLATFLVDAVRRARRASGEARLLIVWCVSLWFVFVVNAFTGIILTTENLLLPFWVLLLLPAIVTVGERRRGAFARA
jgi:O-antigen ligase